MPSLKRVRNHTLELDLDSCLCDCVEYGMKGEVMLWIEAMEFVIERDSEYLRPGNRTTRTLPWARARRRKPSRYSCYYNHVSHLDDVCRTIEALR